VEERLPAPEQLERRARAAARERRAQRGIRLALLHVHVRVREDGGRARRTHERGHDGLRGARPNDEVRAARAQRRAQAVNGLEQEARAVRTDARQARDARSPEPARVEDEDVQHVREARVRGDERLVVREAQIRRTEEDERGAARRGRRHAREFAVL
jgi:hypothetical protein